MCIEIIKKNDKYIIADNCCEHIIAHTEFPESGKKHQVWNKEKTSPCNHVGKYSNYFFVVFQNL